MFDSFFASAKQHIGRGVPRGDGVHNDFSRRKFDGQSVGEAFNRAFRQDTDADAAERGFCRGYKKKKTKEEKRVKRGRWQNKFKVAYLTRY